MARSRDSQRRLKRGLPSFEEEREMRRRHYRRRRSRQKRRREDPQRCLVCWGGKELGLLIMACECRYRTGRGLGPNMAKYHFHCLKGSILHNNDAKCTSCKTEFCHPRIKRWRRSLINHDGTLHRYKEITFGGYVYDGKYYPKQRFMVEERDEEPVDEESSDEESGDEESSDEEWANLDEVLQQLQPFESDSEDEVGQETQPSSDSEDEVAEDIEPFDSEDEGYDLFD